MGEGHVIGLFTQADTPAAAREELQAANELLAHIGRTYARIVLAEDRTVADALEAEGWLCWRGNLSGPAGGERERNGLQRAPRGIGGQGEHGAHHAGRQRRVCRGAGPAADHPAGRPL